MFKFIGGVVTLGLMSYGFFVGYRSKKNKVKVIDVVKQDYLYLGVKLGVLEVKKEEVIK